MSLKDYKKIISKIDEKLTEDELDEETITKLKNARRTIFIIISPPSRLGKWVILDGIEMAPSQIPEKIAPLCGENPEISIF